MKVQFEIQRCHGALALAALLLGLGELRLDSESLTMTTAYPAPSGVYQGLVTTGGSPAGPVNTILVRDAGNVGVGLTGPQAGLHLRSHNPAPLGALQGDLKLQPNAYADIEFDGGSDSIFQFWNTGAASGRTSFMTPGRTELLSINNNGNVGIGTVVPAVTLDVNGSIHELGQSVPRGLNIRWSSVAGIGGPGQCTSYAGCPGGEFPVATQCVLLSGSGNLQNELLGWCTFNCTVACTCQSITSCLTP